MMYVYAECTSDTHSHIRVSVCDRHDSSNDDDDDDDEDDDDEWVMMKSIYTHTVYVYDDVAHSGGCSVSEACACDDDACDSSVLIKLHIHTQQR